ncbi:hypothetical protein INT47_004665 [Mucor saturninus]|uniref:Uncharacterized protein n=1 Tax=Mucor saturninus TaxID=64648 RepID=A0A8H7RLR1_9FUNG|nr:hypothetical protein INT47_004665 [Mucor saturninus]
MIVTYKDHPPPWQDVLPCYRRETFNVLNERVVEMDVDLSLYENDWVALLLIKRSYQNREKYMSPSTEVEGQTQENQAQTNQAQEAKPKKTKLKKTRQ